jgi:hypothetical protein
MDHTILHALQARAQGYRYTHDELVNWLCTEFRISLADSRLYVGEFLCGK